MLKSMRNEKGLTLIEVIVALALLGIIGLAFLGALSTGSKAVITTDKRATAESLARTEMEYVKSQDYSSDPWSYDLPPSGTPADPPSWWDSDHDLPPGYDNYSVNVSATLLDPDGDGTIDDDGLQLITITVYHLGEQVITLEGYKAAR